MANAGEDVDVLPYLPIQFSGFGITDEDDVIVKYEWDFDGDGIFEWSSTETGLVTYVYNQDGVYHTEFRVTNSAGYTALDDRIVTVSSEEAIQQIDEETDSGFLPSLSVTSVIFLLGLISLIRNKRK
jgi:PKD repeat protein